MDKIKSAIEEFEELHNLDPDWKNAKTALAALRTMEWNNQNVNGDGSHIIQAKFNEFQKD